MTVFDFVYQIITGYILPSTYTVENYDQYLFLVCFVVTLMIFWTCFLKPFARFFDYGLFGGSKKHPFTRKRRHDDD